MKPSKKWMVFPLVTALISGVWFSFYVANFVALSNLMNHRASEISLLENDVYFKIRKTYKDFPALANRDEFDFVENDDKHHAYFYEAMNPKGLILLAHGYGSLADGQEASLADYFLQDDWSVFQIDLTSSGRDDEEVVGGFDAGVGDIEDTIRYLQKQARYAQYKDKLCLLGYSWGAYSVSAALAEDYEITPKAVVSLSGFMSPEIEMLSQAKNAVGGIADFIKPMFDLNLMTLRGPRSFLTAVEGYNHAPNCKVMLVQGAKDPSVLSDSGAIWHFADQIEHPERLEKYRGALLERDHRSIWYQDQVGPYYDVEGPKEYQALADQYGSEDAIPEDKIRLIKEKASALDLDLLGAISSFYGEAVAS